MEMLSLEGGAGGLGHVGLPGKDAGEDLRGARYQEAKVPEGSQEAAGDDLWWDGTQRRDQEASQEEKERGCRKIGLRNHLKELVGRAATLQLWNQQASNKAALSLDINSTKRDPPAAAFAARLAR